ncbi:dihydroxy-acid dehydratase, partial [Salipiger thiooxidans]
MTNITPDTLRSARWFAPDDLRSFGHRSRMMQMGYSEEDFYYAGGLRALMKQIEDRLDTSCLTVTGRTLGENLEGA